MTTPRLSYYRPVVLMKPTAMCPGTRRLHLAGCTADVIIHHGVLDECVHFLQRPFSVVVLARHVQESLQGH